MIRLRPMTASEYENYLERAINEYADEKVMAGNWHPSEALELSRQEYQKLLPDGPATPRQHLFTITLDSQPDTLGMIWFAEIDQALQPYAFIYDFYIDEPFRRKGYGAEAMLRVEDEVRACGLKRIGLHVFGHNHPALALYEKLGYEPTNINMLKKLGES